MTLLVHTRSVISFCSGEGESHNEFKDEHEP
jgi:hypothetical protein